MPLFRKKITCNKFFTYKTNTIDISGLSTGLSKSQIAGFDLKVGQFQLKPEFVTATDKLKELDMMQYSICQTIKNISDNSKRDDLLIQLADIKMQMLKIAQQPEKANEITQDMNKDKIITKGTEQIKTDTSQIKDLLLNNNTVEKALKILQTKMPNENAIIMFLSEYNQLTNDIQIGIKSYTSPEWRSLINRIMLFIDSKIK